MKESEARKLVCPFMEEFLRNRPKCIADDCMAWESRRGRCLRMDDPDPLLQVTEDGTLKRL